MPVQFAPERLTDAVRHDIEPLLFKHWGEVAHFKDIPLDPDWAFYAACDHAGVLRVYTARDEGKLVGYACYFVKANPHYQTSIQAVQDVLYLHPDYRGVPALRFIAWCDAQLAAEGIDAVYQHLKAAHEHGHRAMQALGYTEVDRIYAKRLQELPTPVADVLVRDAASV